MTKINDIDWESVIINDTTTSYLNKYELLSLSLATKKIRSKLVSILFKTISISCKNIHKHPNYFENKECCEFSNSKRWEKLKIFSKYNFSKSLAYKSTQIDPFIKLSNETLSKIGKNCRSLALENLSKACYFLLPLTFQFSNLIKLSLFACDIPLLQFNVILAKLNKLQVLSIDSISFLICSVDRELSNNISFPKSLEILTFASNQLVITDHPHLNTVEFVTNEISEYEEVDKEYDVMPQSLPNLEVLNYSKSDHSPKLTNFLEANLQLKELNLPITQLTPVKLSILSKMPNLEKLRITTQEENFDVSELYISSSRLYKLRILNLSLLTPSDTSSVSQFIKLTPNLTHLTIKNIKNNQFTNIDEIINNLKYLKYFTYSEDNISKLGTIAKN